MVGDVGKMVEEIRGGNLKVESKVVLPEVMERVIEVEKKVAVDMGRSYAEVMGGKNKVMGVDEREKLEEKMMVERKKAEESLLEREKRGGKMVEIILELQGTEGEKSGVVGTWDSEKMERELGLDKGDIVKVVGKEGKVVVELKKDGGRDMVEGLREEVWERAVEGKVAEVKTRDSWVGMVMPALSVEKWGGKMRELREELEEKVGLKLMKEPV